MLTIMVKGDEYFDESTQTFTTVGDVELELEHSLVSVSKWESKYKKPFLSIEEKTPEEMFYYVKAMVIYPINSHDTLLRLSNENLEQINEYIESTESATTFGNMPEYKGRNEIITSELIYYWMIVFQIPFDCERWHLNRLFALIRVCNVKNAKPKKMSRGEVARRNRELNAMRKEQYGTRG